jgi:hypothetical protein
MRMNAVALQSLVARDPNGRPHGAIALAEALQTSASTRRALRAAQ